MTDRTRDRVMGGVFLVALAIIVLPMLFDGAGVQSPPPPVLNTPSAPAAPVAAMNPANLANAEALRKRIDSEGFDKSTATRVGDPVLSAPDQRKSETLPPAWGVQLASFTEHSKAVALRDRLRNDGYQSVLTEVKGLTGVSTRVSVGPMVDRDEASKLQAELEKRYGMDGLIVVLGS